MAYGPESGGTIQLGRETVAGTLVAATTIWRGPVKDITDESDHAFPKEAVGFLLDLPRTYIPKIGAKLVIPEAPLTFEQIAHVFEAGIKTATPTGAGPYVYTYAFPTTSTLNTLKNYTLESGNVFAGDANRMGYGFVESFKLSGKAGEAWMVSSEWRGRQKLVNALTGSLALAAVEEALFSGTLLYIDDSGGTIGTTLKSAVMVAAEIAVKTGVMAVWTADRKDFTVVKFVSPEVKFSVTFELENTVGVAAAERAKYVSGATRLIRLDCPGSSSTRNFQLNIAGYWEKFNDWTSANGNITVKADGVARMSSADASLFFQAVVKNNLASLP